MADWAFDPEGKQLVYRDGNLTVRLSSPDEGRVGEFADLAPELDLAPFFLWEWTEYRVTVEGCGPEAKVQVRFGSERAKYDPFDYYKFTYKNYVGRSLIRIVVGGRCLPPLEVEVVSSKFKLDEPESPFYYPDFCRALIDQLVEYCLSFPFAFPAPVYHAVEESPEPPSPLFIFHFLRNHGEQIQAALGAVLARPHRVLSEREDDVLLLQVKEVNGSVLLDILRRPEHWGRVRGGMAEMPIAQWLETPDGTRYAPTRVRQLLKVDTFDTPENRFVKWFAQRLAFWAQWCRHHIRNGAWDEVASLCGFLESALHHQLFAEVGEMAYFPSGSQVLLKRDGYRELLQLYRLFNLARRPFFGPLAEAIDSRDVCTLYEYWCFFKLVKELEQLWGKAKIGLKVEERGGMQWGVIAGFCDDRELVYNKEFGRCRYGSYSVPLRPDFVLHQPGKPIIVFDAKFRFDLALLPNPEERDTYEPEVVEGNVERIVRRADLYKMHTYRDALAAQAAVVLYPGERDVFYRTDHRECTTVCLRELMQPEWTGIGALGFIPRRSEDERQ